jgi:hypothetical protein
MNAHIKLRLQTLTYRRLLRHQGGDRRLSNAFRTIYPWLYSPCEPWPFFQFLDCFTHRLRVSENRVLRRIFGPKRDEVTGGWRKLYNEELHNLYSSASIIRMIKSRRMRWTGHIA